MTVGLYLICYSSLSCNCWLNVFVPTGLIVYLISFFLIIIIVVAFIPIIIIPGILLAQHCQGQPAAASSGTILPEELILTVGCLLFGLRRESLVYAAIIGRKKYLRKTVVT